MYDGRYERIFMTKRNLRKHIRDIFAKCSLDDIWVDDKKIQIEIHSWRDETEIDFNKILTLLNLLQIKTNEFGLINSGVLSINNKIVNYDYEGDFISTVITANHNLEFEKEKWENDRLGYEIRTLMKYQNK